jgi:hypothetical protein
MNQKPAHMLFLDGVYIDSADRSVHGFAGPSCPLAMNSPN